MSEPPAADKPFVPRTHWLPLSDEHWQPIANGIDANSDIADQATAPNGEPLRTAFQAALSQAVQFAAEATTGEIRAELKRFERKLLGAFSGMSPDAHEAFQKHWFFLDFMDLPVGWASFEKEVSEKEPKANDIFLSEVVGLVRRCPGVAQTLPGKQLSDENVALNYPLVRTARAALGVALELAEQHNPAALPVLLRLNRCAMSVFVEHLRTARHTPSIPLAFVA